MIAPLTNKSKKVDPGCESGIIHQQTFFFFKQKTAYEMPKWSSDVCSSDLGERLAQRLGLRPHPIGRDLDREARCRRGGGQGCCGGWREACCQAVGLLAGTLRG